MKTEIQNRIFYINTLIQEQKILRDIYVETREFDRKSGKEELIGSLIDEYTFLNNLLNKKS